MRSLYVNIVKVILYFSHISNRFDEDIIHKGRAEYENKGTYLPLNYRIHSSDIIL